MRTKHATQYAFFGGKGGTGKTTCAAAAAIAAAERGRRVLVMSTDPAHSLGDVLRRKLTARPATIAVRRGSLRACELDADLALTRWLAGRRPALATILERGTWLDRADVESFLDLALPGVDELLGLLEVERLGSAAAYDEVVVDTAPTGHTLRLLATPSTFTNLAHALDLMQEKHRVLAAALGGRSRADASETLIDEIREDGERLVALLRDAARTRLSWVMLPEALSIAESGRAIASLTADGIHVSDLVINRVTLPPPSPCGFCERRRQGETDVLRRLPDMRAPASASARVIPAQETPVRGVAALRALTRTAQPLERWKQTPHRRAVAARAAAPPPTSGKAPGIVLTLAGASTRLVIVGGKGGVGKTTCAAALALATARSRPDRQILLLSTDPAHSLGDVLGQPIGDTARQVRGGPPNLVVREPDAAAGWRARVARYQAAVARLFEAHSSGGHANLSVDRAIVEELLSLAPPGMDEITGMLTIIDAVFPEPGAPRIDLVVVDTAPTGHALRLLAVPAQALAWVRQFMKVLLEFEGVPGFGELASELLALSRGLDRLARLLGNARSSGFLVVTRPEPLPVLETTRLVEWLTVHGIARRALIVNGYTPGTCVRCRAAAERERREAARLTQGPAAGRGIVVETDTVAPPPRGVRQLEAWSATWRMPTWHAEVTD